MSSSNASDPVVSPESSEKSRNTLTDSEKGSIQNDLLPQNCSSIDGPVAILWDIENCRVPKGVNPENVAGNIRTALQVHPIIKGAVVMFSAYGDFNSSTRRVREGCQRTGVKLIDVPNGRKDAADKAILVDMFLFALDNPPPSSIMLISGDVDFAPALHILGQRGYTVILVIPSGRGVSSALCSAGKFVWDWQSVARGEGLVPATKALAPPHQAQQVGPVQEKGPVCEHDLDPDTDYTKSFRNFRELKTPTFGGTEGSIQAEAWLDQVEKDFEVIQCPMEYKICMVDCLLLGEVRSWWQSVRSGHSADVVITWQDFVVAFIEKYYHASVRSEKTSEFMKLEQGSMTVTAYKQCFSKLSRFVSYMIPTEELKALKFHRGLRLSIRTKTYIFPLTSYSELVSRALIAERNEQEGGVHASKGPQNRPVALNEQTEGDVRANIGPQNSVVALNEQTEGDVHASIGPKNRAVALIAERNEQTEGDVHTIIDPQNRAVAVIEQTDGDVDTSIGPENRTVALIAERNEQTEGNVHTSIGPQNRAVAHHCLSTEEDALPRKATAPAKAKRKLCVSCGKFHQNKPCRLITGACYQCGQTGHSAKVCPGGLGQTLAPRDRILLPAPPTILLPARSTTELPAPPTILLQGPATFVLPAPPTKRQATIAPVRALGSYSRTKDNNCIHDISGGEALLPDM